MAQYSLLNDEMLIRLLKADDESAFSEIYRRYWYPLLRQSMRVVREYSSAEDMTQDLFASIWNRRHELELSGSLSSYLFASIRYQSIRYVEKNITRSNYLQRITEAFEMPEDNSLENAETARELEGMIEKAVNTLPQKMRAIFELSRERELSYKDIAFQLKISEETVRKQLYNARKLLRAQLKQPSSWVIAALTAFLHR